MKSATGLTDGDPNYFALDDYMDFVLYFKDSSLMANLTISKIYFTKT